MRTKHVVVVRYDQRWKQWFEDLKERLVSFLGDTALRIEHVGSTSVEGMSAKPIIDIDVVIKDTSDLPEAVKKLSDAGYVHEGDLGIEGREAFCYVGDTQLPLHYLYVCPEDSPELKRHIAFREWLRSHPEEAEEYSRVKERGARMFPYNIDGYIEYKAPFIEDAYAQIKAEEPDTALTVVPDHVENSEKEDQQHA